MLAVETLTFGLGQPVPPVSPAPLAGEALSRAERKRARALVKIVYGLPEAGSVVLVHSPTVVGTWRGLILEMRGEAVAGVTRVIAAPALRDERAVTTGLDVPVFRDPMVDEAREHRRAVAQAWRL